MKLLNLGCGNRLHPDWENCDLNPSNPGTKAVDLLRPLPWASASFEGVYCSHVLEHLPRGKVSSVLKEIRRILQTRGTFRVVVPDLAGIVRAYLQSFEEARKELPGSQLRHEWMTLELLDQLVRETPGGCMGRWWKLVFGGMAGCLPTSYFYRCQIVDLKLALSLILFLVRTLS